MEFGSLLTDLSANMDTICLQVRVSIHDSRKFNYVVVELIVTKRSRVQ